MIAVTLAVVLIVLLLLAAWLSIAETVLQRMDLVRALAIDESEVDGADELVWVLEHRGTCLNATLVLTVLVRVTTAVIGLLLVERFLDDAVAVAVTIAAVATLSLVAAEVAPRSVAMRHLERSALRSAPSIRRVGLAMRPLARFFVVFGRRVAGVPREASGPFPSDEALAEVAVDDLHADDELEEEERAMIRSVVELGDTIAREIMVPRPDMVQVEEQQPLRDVVNTIVERGYSRLPVYREDREQIVGVVYAKDVLRRVALQPDRTTWDDLVRDATFIPETKRIDDLLRELQAQSVHIAFVVDEYGATTGLVTIEDILEEIVGEIVDEHDHEDPLVEILDDGGYAIDARLPVGDLNELLSSHLPDDDWDTVGGLVVGALGRVPDVGETVELNGVQFIAERVQGRRVAKVRVQHTSDRAPTT